MPPAPPNFFPANRRRQRLDPTRHLQGRELWNKVRLHASESHYNTTNNNTSTTHASSQTSNQSNTLSNNIKWFIALLQAIAYEIQPFRIKPALQHVKVFICNEDEDNNLKGLVSNVIERCTSILSTIVKVFNVLYQHAKQMDIKSFVSFFSDNKSMLAKSTTIIIALRIYYSILLYLHELLHIGPIIIILTLSLLLYTIGLGDNTGAGSGIPSAYSVFNRGFRRIMGTVDGEELARQYAGGMAMVLDNNQNNRGNNGGNVDGVIWNENNNNAAQEEEEEQNLINERRRQRRLERLQKHRNENGEEEANAQVPLQDDDDEQDDADDRGDNAAGRRVSGKKSRRKNNLEHRREMQRQRQAAANVDIRMLGAEDRGELHEPLLFEE